MQKLVVQTQLCFKSSFILNEYISISIDLVYFKIHNKTLWCCETNPLQQSIYDTSTTKNVFSVKSLKIMQISSMLIYNLNDNTIDIWYFG